MSLDALDVDDVSSQWGTVDFERFMGKWNYRSVEMQSSPNSFALFDSWIAPKPLFWEDRIVIANADKRLDGAADIALGIAELAIGIFEAANPGTATTAPASIEKGLDQIEQGWEKLTSESDSEKIEVNK